ncbi:hypothetical protein Ahy_B05g077330 [Arachis hypogaea]|uniref:Uncharacterized protein n=1 Tax=Arachis hypogaea TaxID=3818 RepID=A0A444Z4Q8_ARAHY|nr:hypothetical protein Ahy_B05g077330 [Arachis hypogaea]
MTKMKTSLSFSSGSNKLLILFLFFFLFFIFFSLTNCMVFHTHQQRYCDSFNNKIQRSLCMEIQRINHRLLHDDQVPPSSSSKEKRIFDQRYGAEKRLAAFEENVVVEAELA